MSNFGQYNINAIFASEQGDYATLNESAHTDALERQLISTQASPLS
jgi:hypothetical protein